MADFAKAFATEPDAIALLQDPATLRAASTTLDLSRRRALLATNHSVAVISDYYRQMVDDTTYNLLFMLDSAGICVASSNWMDRNSLLGQSYADRLYFQDAVATGSGQQFAVGRLVRVPAFFVARAVRVGGKVVGTAVVRKTADALVAAATTSGAQTVLLDDDGVVVASNQPDLLLRHAGLWGRAVPPGDAALYGDQPLKDLGISQTPTERSTGMVRWNGREYVVAGRKLAHSPYVLWIVDPVDDRLDVRQAFAVTGYFAAAAGLLMLLILERMIVNLLARRIHAAALTAANNALTLANAQLTDLSRTDPLTSCANRRHFIERSIESLALARRSGQPRTLLVLDLDHFKGINDDYGHPAGDLVLIEIARTCLSIIRTTDVFGRIGGEEFALLLWDTDEAGARLLAERLRLAIAALEIHSAKAKIRVTVSIGLAALRPHEDFDVIYSRADAALYNAKLAGRNRYGVA